MSQLGGASLGTPAAESTDSAEEGLNELLAAVSDDTDIKRTISCSDEGILYDPDEGKVEQIATSTPAILAVTHKAAYVVPDVLEPDAEPIEMIPLTEIEDAQSSGLVRRKLTITTTEARYRIRYQLAWIDGNLIRARREYASQLEEDADEHASNGHGQWARQLYIAADDQLACALSVARDQEHIETAPIESQHERLAAKHEDGGFEWPGQEATGD